jgi:hypothetical protein
MLEKITFVVSPNSKKGRDARIPIIIYLVGTWE